jgi:hypothetical protein
MTTSTAIGPSPRHVVGVPLTASIAAAVILFSPPSPTTMTSAAPFVQVDAGTRAGVGAEVFVNPSSTSLQGVSFGRWPEPNAQLTRMGRIRELAPLSYRTWGEVFGVSHTMIGQWLVQEPTEREGLTNVLAALEGAARYHANLGEWLREPLPGLRSRPLDLLAANNWRAFSGAIRSSTAPSVTLDRDELLAQRHMDSSWVVPEAEEVSEA